MPALARTWLTLVCFAAYSGQDAVPAIAGCNQTLTATESPQNITSPDSWSSYSSSQYCWWQIHAISENVDRRVQIDVLQSEVGGNDSECSEEYMEAYDGGIAKKKLIKRWCGTAVPSLISSYDAMFLILKSNRPAFQSRFVIKYFDVTNFTCGGQLVTKGQLWSTFYFPPYHAKYPDNLNCTWKISTNNLNAGVSLMVTYDANLLENINCTDSFELQVVKSGFILLAQSCGRHNSQNYESSTTDVSIRLITSKPQIHETLIIVRYKSKYEYKETTSSNCSSLLYARGETWFLTSPGYPVSSQPNLDCIWHITTTSKRYKLQLNVLSSYMKKSPDCDKNYVAFYDGPTVSSRRLAKFCGKDKPWYTSSGSDIVVKYHSDSDSSHVSAYFRIGYKEVEHATYPGCDGEKTYLSAYHGDRYLTSPNYPSDFPANADCSWRIGAEKDNDVIYLNVITARENSVYECDYSYIEVFDGYSERSKSLGKWCGDETPTYKSSRPVVFVRFHSNHSSMRSGFEIRYSLKDTSSLNIGAIVSGILGSIAFLRLIRLVIFYCSKQRKKDVSTPTPASKAMV